MNKKELIKEAIFNHKKTGYTDGLVLHLDGIYNTRNGHNANSNVWEDLSGNNYDFSYHFLANNSLWTDKSYSLNGGYNRTLVCNTAIMSGFTQATIEVRYKTNTTQNTWIFQNRSNSNVEGCFQMCTTLNRSVTAGNIYKANGNCVYIEEGNVNNDLNKQYTVSFSYNNGAFKIYTNGVLKQTAEYFKSSYGGTNQERITDADFAEIASRTVYSLGSGLPWTAGFGMNGEIYSVRIYPVALSENEILNNYDIDNKRFG